MTTGFLTVLDADGERRKIGGTVDENGVLFMARSIVPATLVSSAAVEGAHIFSVTPGGVFSVTATGLTADAWLLLFDAIAAPADGNVEPVAAMRAPSLALVQIAFGGVPASFANGLVGVLSSSGPFTKTTGPTGFLSALMA